MESIAETPVSKQKKSKEEIYFQLRNIVVDVYLSAIGPTAFAVYAVILRRAGQSSSGYPRRRDIAQLVGISLDAVDNALKRLTGEDERLAASGLKPLIRKEYRISDYGDPTSNRYHILTDISAVGPGDIPPRRQRRSDLGTKRGSQ